VQPIFKMDQNKTNYMWCFQFSQKPILQFFHLKFTHLIIVIWKPKSDFVIWTKKLVILNCNMLHVCEQFVIYPSTYPYVLQSRSSSFLKKIFYNSNSIISASPFWLCCDMRWTFLMDWASLLVKEMVVNIQNSLIFVQLNEGIWKSQFLNFFKFWEFTFFLTWKIWFQYI